jgi:hypothetical protein
MPEIGNTLMMGPRQPRLSSGAQLPETIENFEIISAIEDWYGKIAETLSSGAGRLIMRNELLRQLQTQASLTVAHVIAMAEAGHVPAIEALRVHIASHLDQGGKWEELTDQLRGWGIQALLQPVVAGYSDGRHLLVDTWVRDIAVAFLVRESANHFGLHKRKAAQYVAIVLSRHGFKLKRQQIERIYRDRATMAERIVAFMTSTQP